MAATVIAKIGTGADLRLFKAGKKVVDAIGGTTGISIATAAEIAANPIVDTAELMRIRDLVPIIGRGKKNNRPVSIRFLCAKSKVDGLMTAGKVNVDSVEYTNLSASARRQILK